MYEKTVIFFFFIFCICYPKYTQKNKSRASYCKSIFFLRNVFIDVKGTHFLFLFAFTAAGVVQCGAIKRLPIHQP